MTDLLIVAATLAAAHLLLRALWTWLAAVDRRARMRLRIDRMAADRHTINTPGAMPPGVGRGRAMLLASELDCSVADAAWVLYYEDTMRRLRARLHPRPFGGRR